MPATARVARRLDSAGSDQRSDLVAGTASAFPWGNRVQVRHPACASGACQVPTPRAALARIWQVRLALESKGVAHVSVLWANQEFLIGERIARQC
jgi:hypothetical protein